MDSAIFAAGCFWGVEDTFRHLDGVLETEVGYTGGSLANPTYHQVCGGNTGHAEAVRVKYDPSVISFEQLLDQFWSCHNPTQGNRQGPDIGEQYRSAIFYTSDTQRSQAEQSFKQLEESKKHNRPLTTEIVPATEFYRAEEYHQQYFEKRGVSSCRV